MPEKRKKKKLVRDRHLLYEASVQSPETDLEFFQRIYRGKRRRPLRALREDFCGTALLACTWVAQGSQNRAWGVDLHRPTLAWGEQRHASRLGKARRRFESVCADVCDVQKPKVDLVCALNFSYSVFHTRDKLRDYFRAVRGSLRRQGIFVLDAFGGTETMGEMVEKRKIPRSVAADGTRVPGFQYIWEQSYFNVIDHRIKCHISFKLKDGTKLRRAFNYDWRLWTLPEMRELLLEAGFRETAVFLEGWDDETGDTDGVFRRRTYYQNEDGWVGYVVGYS